MRLCLIIFLSLIISPIAWSWQTVKDVDKINDEKIVQFLQESKQPVWARKKATLSVAINCSQKKWSLLLIHPWIVGSGPVQMRIDKEKAEPFYAEPSSSRKVLFIGDSSSTDGDDPKSVIEKISKGKNLVIQYNESVGKIVIAEFALNALAEKIKDPCK